MEVKLQVCMALPHLEMHCNVFRASEVALEAAVAHLSIFALDEP